MSCNIISSPFPDTATLSVPFPPSCCEPGSGVTAFPRCDYLYSTLNYCNGPSVPAGQAYASCFCNQALFNAYYDCESEYRLCLGSPAQDEAIQDQLSIWHSACDPRITFTPTTPVISTILSGNSYQPNWCSRAVSACASGTMENSLCHNSHLTDPAGYSSCACQPELISIQYTCQYLGNTSCLLTTAELTNLGFYPYCTNLLDVLGGANSNATAPVSQPATTTVDPSTGLTSSSPGGIPSTTSPSSQTSAISSSAGSSTTTQPVLPGPASSSIVAPPKSSEGNMLRGQWVVQYLVWAVMVLIVLLMLFS